MCQSKLTELLRELTEFAAIISELIFAELPEKAVTVVVPITRKDFVKPEV